MCQVGLHTCQRMALFVPPSDRPVKTDRQTYTDSQHFCIPVFLHLGVDMCRLLHLPILQTSNFQHFCMRRQVRISICIFWYRSVEVQNPFMLYICALPMFQNFITSSNGKSILVCAYPVLNCWCTEMLTNCRYYIMRIIWYGLYLSAFAEGKFVQASCKKCTSLPSAQPTHHQIGLRTRVNCKICLKAAVLHEFFVFIQLVLCGFVWSGPSSYKETPQLSWSVWARKSWAVLPH